MAVVELIMPKMGESIIEATIIAWLKKEGESIEADESVLEIATDKVDSEIPSPVGGVIEKIFFHKDDVVEVGATLAWIQTEEVKKSEPKPSISPSESNKPEVLTGEFNEGPDIAEQHNQPKTPIALSRKSITDRIPSMVKGKFYSPLVRNIARAEGITLEELNSLKGSGSDGRVTKFDILNYIDLKKLEIRSSLRRADAVLESPVIDPSTSTFTTSSQNVSEKAQSQVFKRQSEDEVIEMSRMRRVIADHMRHSIETSAHVTSFIEADATRLVNWRKRIKHEYQSRFGENLTYSPLFTEAVIKALHDYPHINASLKGNQLIVKKAVNIGIATAMENGNLIVPIIHNAGELNLHGLTKKLNDLTSRARINKLKPEEIQGGTFTISNIGTFGNIMGTPIINQPQLAVLALGAIKKKPVIQETEEGDIIAIRHMMYLSLSFDHRVIDGYQGGVFLNRIAHYIETFDVNRSL